MSVTGSCSKCGSNAVIRSDGSVTELGMRNKKTRIVRLSGYTVNRYLCLHCGHTEDWITAK